MNDEPRNRDRNGGLFVGGLLIALGVVFLLDRLDIMDVGELFSTFWPLILVAIGLKMILDRDRSQTKKTRPQVIRGFTLKAPCNTTGSSETFAAG